MPRGIKKTEVERARELFEKARVAIDVYERLGRNPDFQAFLENAIENPVNMILDLMETAPLDQLPILREQVRVLRSIKKHFNTTVSRKEEVQNKLSQLN